MASPFAFVLLVAGCLGSPPHAIDVDPDASSARDAAAPGLDALACPAYPALAPFADDFSTGDLEWAIEPKIQRDGAGAIAAGVTGGVLRFAPAAEGGDNAWVKSVEFDISDGRVALRVPTLTTDGDCEAYVTLLAAVVQHRMRFDGVRLRTPGGSAITYDPEVHAWWQIRNQDGVLHFETSPDGITWSQIDQIPTGLDATRVRIEIGISVADAGAATRGEFAIDDLDLPPCR